MLNSDSLYHRLFSLELAELITLPPDSSLWDWQPQVRYYLLDMSAFAGQDLARRDGLAALLFRIEQRQSQDAFKKLIVEVGDWFSRHPEFEPLKQIFADLIKQTIEGVGLKIPIPDNFEGQNTVLATHG